ncbi:FIGNL1-interacting regulator of recombination and mitosis-like [Antedon mediterranea]|uniref:FIGNL1-interacting regulator of recombination and mitosis-like n=1 Tax=Antedon mediterranea TaxID=105859 RepID=UPI003AF83A39
MFDECINKLQCSLTESADVINEAGVVPQLKVLMEIVDTLLLYVNHVCKLPDVKFEYVSSLPPSAVHIIKQSFEHCKVSNSLYGELFQCVSEHLMALFKKAHQLQKSLISLMELLPLTSETPDDCINCFTEVCGVFHDVCCIISKMDLALMVSTWKFLVKIITKHKEYMQHKLNVSEFVSSLCKHIQESFDTCLEQAPKLQQSGTATATVSGTSSDSSTGTANSASFGDEKSFQRNLKICHLSAKMLVHLLKEYGELAMLKLRSLYQMLLLFYSKSPPSLKAPELTEQSHECLKTSLLVCTEPILQLLCNEKHFCEIVTIHENDCSVDSEFAQCLLLIAIMKQLPSCNNETQDLWLAPEQTSHTEPRNSILESLFESVSACYPELSLPVQLTGVRCVGKPLEPISFHQYLITYTSAYIASIQAKHFHIVEGVLLKWCLNTKTHVAMVSIDLWCFLARYGTAEVCNSHVKGLVQILSKVPAGYHNVQCTHLMMLVGRLVTFMRDDHLAQLVTEYPPSEHTCLWSSLPLSVFTVETRQSIRDNVISTSNKRITEWLLDTNLQTLTDVYELCPHVAALGNIYQHYESKHSSVLQNVERLWFILDIQSIKDHVFLILLIHLSSYLLGQFTNDILIKVLDHLNQVIHAGVSSDVLLAVVDFLSKMGKLTFKTQNQVDDVITDDFIVDDITSRISSLFSSLLADTCYVVHQQALSVFSDFAEETVYESIVTDSLVDDSTQAATVQFLQQTPHGCSDDRQTEITRLEHQKELINKKEEYVPMKTITTEYENIEPSAKRHRGNDDENKLRKLTTQLQECITKVQGWKQETGILPDWFRQDVKDISKQLTDICS